MDEYWLGLLGIVLLSSWTMIEDFCEAFLMGLSWITLEVLSWTWRGSANGLAFRSSLSGI